MSIKTGDPVEVVSEDLTDFGINKGDKGWANSVTIIPGEGTYVFYMPEEEKQFYVVKAESLKFDESRDGLELNKDTIYKG